MSIDDHPLPTQWRRVDWSRTGYVSYRITHLCGCANGWTAHIAGGAPDVWQRDCSD